VRWKTFAFISAVGLMFSISSFVEGNQDVKRTKPSVKKIHEQQFSGILQGMDVASGSDLIATAFSTLNLQVWHMDTGQIAFQLTLPDPETDARQKSLADVEPMRVHFSPDGRTLAVSYLSRILLYDTSSWTQIGSLGVEGENNLRDALIPTLQKRPPGAEKANGKEVQVQETLTELMKRGDGRTRITDFGFTSDGASILAAYCKGHCYDNIYLPRLGAWSTGKDPTRLWQVQTSQLRWELVLDPKGIIGRIVLSPNGKLFAASDKGGGLCQVRVYEVQTGQLISSLPAIHFLFAAPPIMFTPQSGLLVTFQAVEGTPKSHPWMRLAIYDPQDANKVAEFDRTQSASDADISTDGEWLATTTWNGWAFQIWDMVSRRLVKTVAPGGLMSTPDIDMIRFSKDGKSLVVGSRVKGRIEVYRFE
jgi:WD40 repeat protein